jgi:pilus assembly protein FimV
MATALAVCLGLYGLDATALSLGRITVQSALGEPLRAEIDIPDINAEEASSLKISVALPEAFRAAGLDYNPAMASLQATLQRRQDGRSYLRLRSERSINDPFVDMILEANWATGRIVRDYTLLFDPPGLRQSAAATPTPSQVPAAPAALPPSGTLAPDSEPARSANAPAMRPTMPRQAIAKVPRQSRADKPPSPKIGQLTVKPGDTAGRIAAAVKPVNVSLDQMLVALLRANPQAFIHDNVNRIKAGAVMTLPTAEQAQATPAAEATQMVIAQSKDFNYFRRELAGSAPNAKVIAAERQASGKVQTQVQDKKPTTAAPDKLTLSKGAIQAQPVVAQAAQDRSAAAAAARAAEISKNISELAKLGAASGPAAGATAAPPKAAMPASATGLASPVPTLPTIAASSAPVAAKSGAAKPVVAAAQPASAPKPATSAPKPAASVAKGPAATARPPSETGLVDQLIDNPLAPAGALGLIALLAGFGYYHFRKRKHAAQADSAFLESRLQPDSFFGASGGQSVDTSDAAATGSSMVYSPSQLDAVDDVDPVAEADVYLAYGRDLQAEEILKDALRINPGRIAIHQKLLAIFAKRRDLKAFEATATQVFRICNGEGSEWEQICELGLSIDPDNAFYQSGGQPNNPDGTPSRPTPLDFTLDAAHDAARGQTPAAQRGSATELDLDLDFSLDEHPVSAIRDASASSTRPAARAQVEEHGTAALDLDFGLENPPAAPFEAPEATVKIQPVKFSLPEPDTARSDLADTVADHEAFKQQASASFGATTPVTLAVPEPKPVATSDAGMMEFDLGSLSLDLGDLTSADGNAAPDAPEDPLATKLALADEFRDIGDDDGARALIKEVISEATGDMKIKAQRALSQL